MAKILVVDDLPADREYLEVLLGYAGHRVLSAADGEEALRIARVQRPDLAIVDIVMPTMDGLEFVKRLRADSNMSGTRVMFYTASFLRDEAARLASAGHVEKVIVKPAEPESIIKAVNDILGVAAPPLQPVMPRLEVRERGALANVTLHKTQRELEAISQRLAVLVDLGREFTALTDSNRLLERLGAAARPLLGARYAIVGLIHEDGNRFERFFVSGLSATSRPVLPHPSPVSGTFGQLLDNDGPTMRQERGINPSEFGLPPDCARISSVLCVPMRVPSRTIGMLCLLNKVGADGFSDQEMRIAATMTAQVGVAYDNIRLMRETERRLEYVNALRAIDNAITGSLDLRLTLDVVLDQVVSHLRVDAATILMLNRGTNYLEAAAVRGFRSSDADRRAMKFGDGHAGFAAVERRTFGIANASMLDGEGPPMVGGERFEAYYVAPLVSKGRVLGVLEAFNRSPLDPTKDWIRFLEALAGQAALAIDEANLFRDLQRANADLIQAYDSTLEGWVHALDLRDRETEGHTQRVTQLTVELATAWGFSEQELVHVRRGALLHDIGKLGIPDSILLKAGPLSDDEWVVMKRHPTFAFEWLRPIAYLRPALDVPYCHHEKCDGTGYPRGLAGDSIPLAARLFSVVDVWDALKSDRPYRAAWSTEKVKAHILALAGTHLDPDAVAGFFKLPLLAAES
jgi:response regulator RpfG family c-di-GMP phosphodiesterase